VRFRWCHDGSVAARCPRRLVCCWGRVDEYSAGQGTVALQFGEHLGMVVSVILQKVLPRLEM